MDWTEVGDRCWVRRYPQWDVNVGVVAGADGLLVLDTRGTAQQGRALRDDVTRLDPRPVRWVVNSHDHFDHTFGNIAFDASTAVWAHENAARGLDRSADRIRRLCHEDTDPDTDPDTDSDLDSDTNTDSDTDSDTVALNRAVIDTELRRPDRTFTADVLLDLGDRRVTLTWAGRGHTDGDAWLLVPDADVVFAGDLVEESAPPAFGVDCYPFEWAPTLDRALGRIGDGTTVVPGHGQPVTRGFVAAQRDEIARVATLLAEMVTAGVPIEQAEGELGRRNPPWEPAWLREAIGRAYEQLG